MRFSFIRDIRNYIYTQKCFKLMIANQTLRRQYKLRITQLGVMWMPHKIQKTVPESYRDEMIVGHLMMLNETIMVMNLDGCVELDYRVVNTDEDFVYYVIKLVPYIPSLSFWNIIKFTVLITALVFFANKYHLFDGRGKIIDAFIAFLETLKK